jgi:ABC-type lipoprotein release transport system permease subunit
MSLLLKLAIRNIFRNKRRTFIAGSAIGIGLASLIFVDAIIKGMEHNMIASATESFLGDAEIHRAGFRETYDVDKTIESPAEVESRLEHDKIVARFAPRVLSYAMISSPANVSSVLMVGADPSKEKYLSDIDEAIVQGSFFESADPHDIVIGSKLAADLEATIGSRIVLTVAQAHSGDLSQEMFRVSGIFDMNIKEMDQGMVMVRLGEAQKMLGIGSNIHEIALRFVGMEYARDPNLPFWKEYSQSGNEAVGWPVLLPEMSAAFELSQFSTLIVAIILFGVVALGIINTIFMSLHERMFEFGVLRAVGTRAGGMARLILLESAALAVLSILIGVVLGYVITEIVMKTGIDYRGIEFSGVTFRRLLYPILEIKQFLLYPVAVFVFTVVVALYPATYAARMSPADAMRRSF